MKKTLIFMFVTAVTILFAIEAFAGWQLCRWKLYDDFESYETIEDMKNSPKWSISAEDELDAKFSIENGRLRIEHYAGNPFDSAWAFLTEKAEEILGIRATMEVESWEGVVIARIGAFIGKLPQNPNQLVWSHLGLFNAPVTWQEDDLEFVRGYATVIDKFDNWFYDLIYTEFGVNKITILKEPYTITAKWLKHWIIFRVDDPDDVGEAIFRFTEKVDKPDEPFKAIGTRSFSPDGTCVVYIDDVYVYKYRYDDDDDDDYGED